MLLLLLLVIFILNFCKVIIFRICFIFSEVGLWSFIFYGLVIMLFICPDVIDLCCIFFRRGDCVVDFFHSSCWGYLL